MTDGCVAAIFILTQQEPIHKKKKKKEKKLDSWLFCVFKKEITSTAM